MDDDCIFCRIADGRAPSHRVWESSEHLAFLSIFPNTRGFTVVIPKRHRPSYAFALADSELAALTLAAKRVGRLLDRALTGVARTAMIFEGYGVDHVHAKLFPMHGTAEIEGWQAILSDVRTVFTRYDGYVASNDGPRADDVELAALAASIRVCGDGA